MHRSRVLCQVGVKQMTGNAECCGVLMVKKVRAAEVLLMTCPMLNSGRMIGFNAKEVPATIPVR